MGNASDLSAGTYVYSYTSGGTYTLDTSFTADLVIYLIRGNLRITNNFNLPANSAAVFVVDGSVFVAGNVGNIAGLYIVNNTFNIEREIGAVPIPLPFSMNGMILTNTLSLNRIYGDIANPTYQFTFQPQYAVKLIPFLGRSQISWQELAP